MRGCVVGLVLFLLLFASCHRKQPGNVLDESRMESVLQDLHLARALASQRDSTSFYQEYYFLEALKRNRISKEEFDRSMLWYAQHADLLYKIYDRISQRLEKESSALGVATSNTRLYSSLSSQGDTANVWNGGSYYLLSPVGVSNRMSFRVVADSTFHPYDTYLIHFVSKFVYSEGQRDAYVGLSVTYDNDSVQSIVTRLYNDGDFSMQLLSEGRRIKHVDGFVYLNAHCSDKPKLLFLMNPSLIRFHKPEMAKPKVEEAPADTLKRDSLKVVDADSSRRKLKIDNSCHLKPIPVRKMMR